MSSNEHVAQNAKVAVFVVFDFGNAPRVLTCADAFFADLEDTVRADHGKRHLFL